MKMSAIYREYYINKLISLRDKNIIKVLTGIRRAGKSTILEDFKNYLIKTGVNKKNIIFINLDDKNYRHLLDSDKLHDYILNNIDLNVKNYIFLDEIQNVYQFEKCINSLFLRENSNWYKRLNRTRESFPYFVEEMKINYKLTTEDKINKTLDNISMLQGFLDVLK